MAVNPDKNIVEQSLIARLIGKIKRIAIDISDDVSAEETRAMAAEAAAKTVVTAGENCTVDKTIAADGHDVYTINADGKPQIPADWDQQDSSKPDFIKNKPNLALKEDVANKKQSIDPTSTTEFGSSKAVADFVNSSVATNTANFLGSFSLSDLSLTYPATDVQIAAALNSHTWPSGVTPTNNDYVYVEIQNPQTTGVDDKVERFKFSELLESWGYEYTLNNSSFTAAEMATLESGVTASDKTAWNSHVSNTSNPHNVTTAQIGAEPSFSVLPINKGGTGKTSGNAATNNLFSDINSVNTDPDDTARIVFKYGTPSDSNGIFFARAITNLWNYIKGKISSVLGLSENGYTGNAATATSATTATNYASGGGIADALANKQDSLGINSSSGDTGKFLNERGVFATPSYPSVPSVVNSLTSSSTTDALSAAMGKSLDDGKLAKADASISVDGLSGYRWYKVAETSFTGAYGNKSAAFEINYTDSDWKITTLLIDFNIRSQNANKPYAVSMTAVATKVLSECDVRIVSRGAISSRKVEIWVKCGSSESRSSAFIGEHASGGYLYNTTSTFTYTSYSATAGQVEPTTDEPNNVYVYTPTIVSFDLTRAASWINSGTFDVARIPTASSVTNDATRVPTSQAVYNYACPAPRPRELLTGHTDSFLIYREATGNVYRCQNFRLYSDAQNGFIFIAGDDSNTSGFGNNNRVVFRLYRNGGKLTTLKNTAQSTDADNTLTLPSVASGYLPVADANGVGSTSIPVYVDSNGKVKACDPSQMSVGSASFATNADYAATSLAMVDGGGAHLNTGGYNVPVYFNNGVPTPCTTIPHVLNGSFARESGSTLDFTHNLARLNGAGTSPLSFQFWVYNLNNKVIVRVYTNLGGAKNSRYAGQPIKGVVSITCRDQYQGLDNKLTVEDVDIASLGSTISGSNTYSDIFEYLLSSGHKCDCMINGLLKVGNINGRTFMWKFDITAQKPSSSTTVTFIVRSEVKLNWAYEN